MRVLVVGSGAREHALCLALSRDPAVTGIVCAPGNPGTAGLAEPAAVDVADPAAVAGLAARVRADLTVVGPEAPLVAGVADALRARQLPVFGPSAAAARLEASKAFAKDVMAAAGVPTAGHRVVRTVAEGMAALDAAEGPYVVKDDGLAAGKGVLVTDDRAAAAAHLRAIVDGGRPVVVEEYLDGPEVSLFAVVTEDGDVSALTPAQDAKRVGDGDTGPNTGGMGAYSPLPWAPAGLVDDLLTAVLRPTVAEMARRGTPYAGLLYAGLALTSRGPRVVEFNCRFGDPETQVVLARLTTPLTEVLTGRSEPAWSADAAVTVVMASAGYPAPPRLGDPVDLPASPPPGVAYLHAGTRRASDGRLVTAGGRVLSVTATGSDLTAARAAAYEGVAAVRFAGAHWRADIAAAAAAWVPTGGDVPAGAGDRSGRMAPPSGPGREQPRGEVPWRQEVR